MSFIVSSAPESTSGAASLFPADAAEHWEVFRDAGHCRVCVSSPASVASIPSETQSDNAPTASAASSNSCPEAIVILDGYLADSSGQPHEPEERTPAARIADLIQCDGFDAVEKLTGSFVAIFIQPDSGNVRVWRDRLGGRTAYWQHDGDRFVLASSSDQIARTLGQVRLNDAWLAHWFGIRWPARPALTPFAGIQELLPGERLEFVDGRVSRQRVPFTMLAAAPRLSPAEWVERFRSTFEKSVEACLPEYGDAAVMLSGGMDSGPTAVIASGLLNDQGRSLTAVSWSLPDLPDADETEHIQTLANALSLRSELFDGGDCVPFDRLTTDLVVTDFPTFNFYRETILRCYQGAADQRLQVILNAAKGDLLYPPWNAQLAELWARGEGRAFVSFLALKLRTLGLLGTWRDPDFRHWVGRLLLPLRRRRAPPPAWLTEAAIACLPETDRWPPEADRHPLPEYASHLIGQAMAWGVAHENLFSQRYGVERRDPFQNEALVKLMLEMPVSMCFRDGMDKWVMREVMRGRMPEKLRAKGRTGLLNSFLRMGFERNREKLKRFLLEEHTDWQHWVRRDYVRDVLEGRTESARGMLVIGNCVGYSLWRQRLDEEGILIR